MELSNAKRVYSGIANETKIWSLTYLSSLAEQLIKLNRFNTFPFFKVKTVVRFTNTQTLKYVIQVCF